MVGRLLLSFVCFFVSNAAADERPNVLLIVAEDQGWGDLALHGNDRIDTPQLDALAASGMRLDRFHVCPDSAPSHASLLTGRYHYRAGVSRDGRGEGTMHAHEITLAEALRATGYATGCFGQWHHGANWPHHPKAQGFDTFAGFPAPDCAAEGNHGDGPALEALTGAAIDFMDAHSGAGRPFFCYLPYPETREIPEPLLAKYRGRNLDAETAAAYARIEQVDTQTGRLLAWLEARGLRGRTLVWYFSATGPKLAPDARSARTNGHLRGGQGSVHEGGVRAPSLLSWPGVFPAGGRFRRITAHLDILPTVLDFCDAAGAVELPWLDGMSLRPALLSGGQPERWPNRLLFTSATPPRYDVANASVAVRTDRWLAIRDLPWRRGGLSEAHSGWELYDLNADPHEWTDLGEDYPYLLSDMRADFSRWMDETTDDGLGPIPTEIGHAQWPAVTLSPGEAASPPNWENGRADPAAWPIEVLEKGGRYAVEIDGALRDGAAPRRMRLSFGESRLDFTWPAPAGVENRPSAGEIDLRPGVGDLMLKPLKSGGGTIVLRSVILRRIGGIK